MVRKKEVDTHLMTLLREWNLQDEAEVPASHGITSLELLKEVNEEHVADLGLPFMQAKIFFS